MGVGRGLRVEVEVLDDERTSTPAVVKGLGWCLTLPAAALCRLVGVVCSLTWRVSVWFVSLGMSVVWFSTESPVFAARCPGCGVTCSRSRARGGGGDRRAQGRGSCAVPVAQYGAGDTANAPARRRHSWSIARRCAHPGRVWGRRRSAGRSDSCASKEPPLQDWLDNWQPRGTPCGPLSSRACKAASEPRPLRRGSGTQGR